ncbi:hypothetical protein VTO42DRAFT_5726 [Malbranchea cinnamomea]
MSPGKWSQKLLNKYLPASPQSPPESSPSMRNDKYQLATPPATPRLKRSLGVPKLAFRSWNPDSIGINSPSHFVAGMWASDPDGVPDPSQIDRRIFDALALSHFSKAEIKSPTQQLEEIVFHDKEIGALLQLKTIKSFEVNRLPLKRKFMSKGIKTDQASGEILGRLLLKLGIPGEYAEDIALKVANDWKFIRSSDQNASFLQGVQSAYFHEGGYESEEIVIGNIVADFEQVDTDRVAAASRRLQQVMGTLNGAPDYGPDDHPDLFLLEREHVNGVMGW